MCVGTFLAPPRPPAPVAPARVAEASRPPGSSAGETPQAPSRTLNNRRRARSNVSRGGTILTSPTGVQTQGSLLTKALLGQ